MSGSSWIFGGGPGGGFRYKAEKAAEGTLSPAIINKTLVRLSQVLGAAADYGLIPANPATGRKRRLKVSRRQASWIEPYQLPAFLDGAKDLLRSAAVLWLPSSPGPGSVSRRRRPSDAST